MSNEIQFVNGLIVKAPNENAPDYVKAKLSIKREDLIGWLQSQAGDWINVEVKESQAGKWYAAVDTWKPEGGERPQRQDRASPREAPPAGFDDDSNIPF